MFPYVSHYVCIWQYIPSFVRPLFVKNFSGFVSDDHCHVLTSMDQNSEISSFYWDFFNFLFWMSKLQLLKYFERILFYDPSVGTGFTALPAFIQLGNIVQRVLEKTVCSAIQVIRVNKEAISSVLYAILFLRLQKMKIPPWLFSIF